MKFHRPHPIVLAASLAAAAAVIGADTKPKSAPPAAKAEEPAKVAKLPPGVMAMVNGEPIKDSEVEEAFARAVASRGVPAESVPADQKNAALRMLLNDVINERLLAKAAAGITVEMATVEAEYVKIRDSRKATDEDVKKDLAQSGMTLEMLKASMQKQMRERQWMDTQIKDKAADASEGDAKEFYEKNPQHFDQPEQVRASHILFRLAPDASPELITAALKKAEAAIERAKKEEFAKLAGELSEEPGAAERGGDLSFFPRQGAMVEPFAAAAFKLKNGELSTEPVRSQFGYHVIKVTDRKDATKQPFAEAKPQIVAYLSRERKRVAIEEVIGALRAKADVQVSAPAPAPIATPGAK